MASPYEVAIHLTVSGNAQAGLAAAGQQINKLNEGVDKLHKAFALLFVGGEMKRWGEEAIGAVKKVLDLAGNFQQVQNQMSAMGMTQKEMAEATVRASKLAASNIHVGALEIMEMNRHAIEIFGGADAASEHIGLMAKLADLQHRWQAGHTGTVGPDVVTSIRDMMKTGEGGILWGKDPRVFDTFAENLMRSLWATGANVSASQYVKAMRASKGAFAGWSDDFKFGIFPAMVQEWQGAGVGASTAYSKLAGGARWRKQGIIEGQRMGIISEEADPTHPYTMRPEYIKGIHEFQADPKIWFDKYLKPVLDATYGPLSVMNIGDRQGAITRLMSDPNAAEFLNRMDREGAKYEKDRPLWHKAKLDMPDGWAEAIVAFEAKWQDLMIALGTPSLAGATNALGGITKAIISLTGVLNQHPDAAKNLLAIATGFGVAMTALGALAIGAGIAGLLGGGVIIVGLTALTGGLAGLAAANWPAVTRWFDSLKNANWNKIITDSLMPIASALKQWFLDLPGMVGDALKGMWDNMKKSLGIKYEGGGFGGGITNTAWTGGAGASSSAIKRMAGAGSISPEVANYIRATAISRGVDPDVALAVAGNEGARGYYTSGIDRGGDNNSSFGPYQLHYSGRGAEGDLFTHATGLDARNRSTWKAQVDWAMKRASQHGWSAWMGARDHGISKWQGIHGSKRSGSETHVHNHIYMDGKEIAKSTSKHLVRAAQYPTSVGRQDGRGTFMGPGAEVFA